VSEGRSSQVPPRVNSPLRSSGSGVCGLLGVDEILDGSDLDLFSRARRAEREDEYGFVGERMAARGIAEQLRLNKTYAMREAQKRFKSQYQSLFPRHNACSSNRRATYVDPDVSLALIILKDLVLRRRTTSDHECRLRIRHVTFSGWYPSASATLFACAKPCALFFGGTFAVEGRVVCM
jgi:hypothetical protein